MRDINHTEAAVFDVVSFGDLQMIDLIDATGLSSDISGDSDRVES
jgi:hypothetical protein